MFSVTYGAQHTKLKANLQLAVTRLKTVVKKKTESNNKARAEIAQLLKDNKAERARIRVEHIIREDNLIEAYEMLELFCEFILARFGVVEHKKNLDDSIAEAVLSILWAAARMVSEIPEFKVLGDQLTMKYGKTIAQAAVNNTLKQPPHQVSPTLLKKITICSPPKILSERYLIVIAQKYKVEFKPDLEIVGEDEISLAEQMLSEFCAGKSEPSAPLPHTSEGQTVAQTDVGMKHPSNLQLIDNPNFANLLDNSVSTLTSASSNTSDNKGPQSLADLDFDNLMQKLKLPKKSQSDIEFDDLLHRFDELKKRKY